MIEIIGKLKTISLDYATGKPVVAFDAEDKSVLQYVEQMQDKKLRIDVKQYKERRTLDQNAYWHKLLGELADVLGTSKPHMKNMLLRSYGQFARHNDRLIEHWIQEDMTDAIDENENVHLYVTPQTAEIDGSMYRLWKMCPKLSNTQHFYGTEECTW